MAEWLDELIAAIQGRTDSLPLPKSIPTPTPDPLDAPPRRPASKPKAKETPKPAPQRQPSYRGAGASGSWTPASSTSQQQAQKRQVQATPSDVPPGYASFLARVRQEDQAAAQRAAVQKPSSPASSAGRKRLAAQYEGEQARAPHILGMRTSDLQESLANAGVMASPEWQREQRIARGEERYTPMVGVKSDPKAQAHDVYKYRMQRRLAEQAERGVFGERLPAPVRKSLEKAKLTAAKLGVDTPHNALQTAAAIKQKGMGGPMSTMETEVSQRPGASEGEQMANLAFGIMAARGLRRPRSPVYEQPHGPQNVPPGGGPPPDEPPPPGGPPDETAVMPAAKPPQGEAVGANIPKGGTTAAESAAQAGRDTRATSRSTTTSQKVMDKVDEAEKRPPLPPTEEKPAESRAARAARKAREAEINAKTQGPATAPAKPDKKIPKGDNKKASDLIEQLRSSVQAGQKKQSLKKFRASLSEHEQARFDKMTPERQAKYMERNAPKPPPDEPKGDGGAPVKPPKPKTPKGGAAAKGDADPPLDKADKAARARQARADKNVAAVRGRTAKDARRIAKFRDTLPPQWLADFDKMAPEHQRDYMVFRAQAQRGMNRGIRRSESEKTLADQARKVVENANKLAAEGRPTAARAAELKKDPAIKAERSKQAQYLLEQRAGQKATGRAIEQGKKDVAKHTQRIAAFRENLPEHKRAGFDKMTPAQKEDYMKFRGEVAGRQAAAAERAIREERKRKNRPSGPSNN